MVRRNGWEDGKRKYIRVNSGAKHNPPPSTPRGRLRSGIEEKEETKKNE